MKLINVEGFVVSTVDFKENSKILNIITKDYGIIGVISNGCKNKKSILKSVSQPLTYAFFNIYYKEDKLSRLVEASIINDFSNIRYDLLRITYYSCILELAYNVMKENSKDGIYDLLVTSVNKINNGLNPMVIFDIFRIKALNHLGVGFVSNSCVCCGSPHIITFSIEEGGFVCNNCISNELIFNEKAIKLLNIYSLIDINSIKKLDIKEENSLVISKLIDEYYDKYTGIYLKSKRLLDRIS